MTEILIGFVPVLHAGYIKLFRRPRRDILGILGPGLYGELERLTREIRAVAPDDMAAAIRALRCFRAVWVCGDAASLGSIPADWKITMPDEDISRHVANKYLSGRDIAFEQVFLRYDLPQSLNRVPPAPAMIVSLASLGELAERAESQARRSPDWWRQVGAVAFRDGSVLLEAHNTHMPAQQSLYALGDPRGNFVPGEHLDITCAHHAERGIIADAARLGIALAGASIYVTTFPCPSCTFSIVRAGFKEVYYRDGYSAVGAAETLRAHRVTLIRVD